MLVWTRPRRAGPVELGRHGGVVEAVAVLPDGRVVSGGGPTGGCWCGTRPTPGAGPVELGRHEGGVEAVAVLPDGRVVTGGRRRAGCWCGTRRRRAPARPSSAATSGGVGAVAVLPDGRVVTAGGHDGRVLVWDPAEPGAGPVELGRHGAG